MIIFTDKLKEILSKNLKERFPYDMIATLGNKNPMSEEVVDLTTNEGIEKDTTVISLKLEELEIKIANSTLNGLLSRYVAETGWNGSTMKNVKVRVVYKDITEEVNEKMDIRIAGYFFQCLSLTVSLTNTIGVRFFTFHNPNPPMREQLDNMDLFASLFK